MSVKTFAYWLRKYKQDKDLPVEKNDNIKKAFIPGEVSNAPNLAPDCGSIEVTFPNGVQVSFPAGIDVS